MKKAVVYFEPDNLLSTGINGTVDVIRQFYNIGNTMMLGYDEDHEDGYPYTIKGLKIFDEEWKLIHQEGDCTSKYEQIENLNDKKLKCPKCNSINSVKSWDAKTSVSNYGLNLVRWEEKEKLKAWFTCPGCGEETKGEDIIEEEWNSMVKKMTFHDYILSECERQWNECQAEQHGEWASQSDDTKAEYYNDMHSHLLPTKGELDGIID